MSSRKGVIYLIKNKHNDKCYIGQAVQYLSSKVKWGMEGRWKSHIREALSGEKDHCLLLNQAIRKYTSDSFTIECLCECEDSDELNQKEIEYIQLYSTLAPKGYNLKTGGANGQDSDITKNKKSESAKNRKPHSDETKIRIRLGQLGNKRTDNDEKLPLFIISTGYKYTINKFYTSLDLSTHISKSFPTLEEAKNYLDKLKIIYEDVYNYVIDKMDEKNKAQTKIINKITELPNNIYPHYDGIILSGYYVSNLTNHFGGKIPPKYFTDKTNRWNLDNAIKYIQQINMINKNKIIVEDWNNIDTIHKRNKNGSDKIYLPKYINIVKSKNIQVGYSVNGIVLSDNKKYYKKFTKSKFTMEEKYKMACNHLEDIKKQI